MKLSATSGVTVKTNELERSKHSHTEEGEYLRLHVDTRPESVVYVCTSQLIGGWLFVIQEGCVVAVIVVDRTRGAMSTLSSMKAPNDLLVDSRWPFPAFRTPCGIQDHL